MSESKTQIMSLFDKNKSITHKKAKELLPDLTQGQIAGAIYKLKQAGQLKQNDKKEYVKVDGA